MARMGRHLFILISLAAGLMAQQQAQSPLPELPPDIPKDAVLRMVLSDQKPSGQDAVWKSPDETIREFFQFNDRGRGPKIYTTYRLDEKGLIVFEESKGLDYMKSPVEERFSLIGSQAVWKNKSEDEKQANARGKFYIELNGGAEGAAILARALLTNGGNLPVLPSGEASIRKVLSIPVEGNGHKRTATLYEIKGLDYTPN